VKNLDYEFALVGLSSNSEPKGVWFDKEIESKKVKYFSIATIDEVANSKLPKRLYTYLKLKKYISILNQEKVDLVFTQSPQFVFLIEKFNWNKFYYCFAGLENSVGNSKFLALRVFGELYEKKLFGILKAKCDLIFAAADSKSIEKKIRKYNLNKRQIVSFPTRFDENVFHLKSQSDLRNKYKFSEKTKIILTTGRLSHVKGWKLLVDSFRILNKKLEDSLFVFIGDGEDRKN